MNESADELLDRAIGQVVLAANALTDPVISDDLKNALNALAELRRPDDVYSRLASQLPQVTSPVGAGMIAIYLGAGVEHGCNPEPAIPGLFDTLLRCSRSIRLTEDGEIAGTLDDRLIPGMQSLGQGLVAHLARSPVQRANYAHRADILEELDRTEHISLGVHWVAALLRKRSGTLLVVDVQHRKAYVTRYQNIANSFHLFTLLQDALSKVMSLQRTVPDDVLAVARGQSQERVSDQSWWHYGPGTVPEANIAASIWGEGSPDEIPQIDGYQVVLLWPPILGSRMWDGGFFMPYHAAAPPDVTIINELPPAEVDEWWQKLKLPLETSAPVNPEKPFWKFW